MLKPCFVKMLGKLCVCALAILSILQLAQGSYVNTHMYPTCLGTGLPNFSYAKGLQVIENTSTASCTNNNLIVQSPQLNVTWFYYESYSPPTCGNGNLPGGDQCCHSTVTSTITFYHTVFVNGDLIAEGTSTGVVTAGKYLGHWAIWVLSKNTANLAINCDKPYGQEASVGLVELTIIGGPVCVNGVLIKEQCPGARSDV